jgi:hypothetical protein
VTAAERQVVIWDVAAGQDLRRLRVPQGTSRFYRVSPTFAGDGRTLVAFLPEARSALERLQARGAAP